MTDAPAVYVRGEMTGLMWDAVDEFKMDCASEKDANGAYVYTLILTNVKGQFKIADADWKVVNYGATGDLAENVGKDSNNQDIMAVVVSGENGGNTYDAWSGSSVSFYIDVTDKSALLTFSYIPGEEHQTLKVEAKESGIENISAEQNGDVQYYNLNGMRVNGENLRGLYIKVANGRAQKVLIK